MTNEPGGAARPNAVQITGRLDEPLSRWKWLVKWFLALPHVLALVGLGVAFVVTTVVAGFGILFTGRYPRSLFDFNVGVLRWTWRVGFYAFGGIATDRYPPFSLQSDPSYPADLTVRYPEHLNRGLVLVKWWLLAIPHYIVLAILTGGIGVHTGGLMGLAMLAAGVVLLFTGIYPQSLFDVVMGCNRWSYRVLAYAALMTDEYPPFRFDAGGEEPQGASASVPTPPVAPGAPVAAV